MNRKFDAFNLLMIAMMMLFSSFVFAEEQAPDLEGRISNIEYTKSIILVRNELKNNLGNIDYRIRVKQGMISGYKINDRLKIWLDPNDRVQAEMIELVSH